MGLMTQAIFGADNKSRLARKQVVEQVVKQVIEEATSNIIIQRSIKKTKKKYYNILPLCVIFMYIYAVVETSQTSGLGATECMNYKKVESVFDRGSLCVPGDVIPNFFQKCYSNENCKKDHCYFLSNRCSLGCKGDKWGDTCSKTNDKCKYGVSIENGSCSEFAGENEPSFQCIPRYRGVFCNKKCPENCYDESCVNNGTCHKTAEVTQRCVDRWWGNYCNRSCSSTCSMSFCDSETGNCRVPNLDSNGALNYVTDEDLGAKDKAKHCEHGYYGRQCENRCSYKICTKEGNEYILTEKSREEDENNGECKTSDYRKLLGLSKEGALAAKDIRKAYRRKSLSYHPDKRKGKDEGCFNHLVEATKFLLEETASTFN